MLSIALVAVLACQSVAAPPAPAPGPGPLTIRLDALTARPAPATTPAPTAPQSGGDFLRSQAAAPRPAQAPVTEPSVADLFRERNAREAAAKAAANKAAADQAAAVPDGTYRCRRTDSGLVCGNNEEAMRQTEAANKAALDRLMAPN